MRLGLVGYGQGGRYFHAPFIEAATGIELAGVVTRSQERRRLLAVDYPAEASACGATAISINPPALGVPAVANAHARGLLVYAWIRKPAAHASAIELGVDGLVTDWVGTARAERSNGSTDPT